MKPLRILCLLLICLVSISWQGRDKKIGDPPRKAWMGIYGSFSARGMKVDSVAKYSTLHDLGVMPGDTVVKLNDIAIIDADAYNNTATEIRTNDPVAVVYKRGNKETERKGIGKMRPFEQNPLMEVVYDWTSIGECSLRVVVRRPFGVTNTLPAVLMIPGYNCSSVENYALGSYGRLIETWIKAGFVVVTIEKSGMGDSYGCVPCKETDLSTDIKVFEAGYKYMETLRYVDKRNLFIWGHSMGGIIAPLVAQNNKPRGVIAYATVYRPWSEFLLEMHRIQWPLEGKSYAETEDKLRLMQKVYYEFFRYKRSPRQLYQSAEFRDIVASEMEYKPGKNDMWGRHWRFWQQLDSLDLARSWEAINAPVLSIFGGADHVACSELEHKLIVNTVNSTHPGKAMHINIPDLDHLLTINPNHDSAHKNFMNAAYKKDHFHQGFADTTVWWMKEQMVR